MKNTPAFFRDTKLNLNLRTYYLWQDNTGSQIKEAWVIGGALSYQSGWLLDHLSTGAVLYASQPLSAPDDRDGTLLLAPGQEGYTVLGQIYGRVKLEEAFMVNGSLNFARLGLKGVTAYALWVHGWGALDPGTNSFMYQQDKYDFDLQWRPEKGIALACAFGTASFVPQINAT